MYPYKNIINLTTIQLFKARLHLGHKTNNLNLKMLVYLLGTRHKINIFNLQHILISLRIIFKAISEIVKQRGHFFLIGTNKDLPMIEIFYYFLLKYSVLNPKEKNFFITGFVGSKWIGGSFSNWKKTFQFFNFIQKSSLRKQESIRYKKYFKNLQGLNQNKKKPIPDFVFFFNNDKKALKEIQHLHIPVIGITDSNTNPDSFLYNLPGNDDSLESIQFFCNFLEQAIVEGKQKDQERFFLFCLKKIKKYIY
jgi:small subunit ribosomal protein S2